MKIGDYVLNIKELHTITGVIPPLSLGIILEQKTPIIGSLLVRFEGFPMVLVDHQFFRKLTEEEKQFYKNENWNKS